MPSFVLGLAVVFAALPADAASSALKELMKKVGVQTASGDAKALVPLLVQTKAAKPSGDSAFDGWDAIADRGKAAAEAGDLDAAKATCKDCHQKFRDAYRDKYGSKAP